MTSRPGLAAILTLLLVGCGARTGLLDDSAESPDADHPVQECDRPADCDDGSTCTVDICTDRGICRHELEPMGDLQELPSPGYVLDATAAHGAALLMTQRPALFEYDLDGPVGPEESLPVIDSDRSFDQAIAQTDSGLALVAHAYDGLELVHLDRPDLRTRIEPAGIYIHLTWSGTQLVATTAGEARSADWDTCGLAWADGAGSWISTGMEFTRGSCQMSTMPWGHGTPSSRRPLGFTEDGEAIYLTITEDGDVQRLIASPGAQEVEHFVISAPGPAYYSSMTATMGGGRIGAIWVQRDEDLGPRQITAAVFDWDMEYVADPLAFDSVSTSEDGGAYAPRMAIGFCEGRFVAIFNDAESTAVIQFTPEGEQLGEVIRWGDPIWGGVGIDVLCLEGGVIMALPYEVASLRCPSS